MKALCLGLSLLLALFTTRARAEPGSAGEAAPAQLEAQAAPARLVDLNHASEEELCELPGIGPARAQAILAFRAAHGGFSSVSQLLRVKGFGRAMLKRLRPLLTLSPPAASPDAAPLVR